MSTNVFGMDLSVKRADENMNSQWRRHGGEWGGPDPPTSVQTPPEISANPLKMFIYIGGGGYPIHVYWNFYCSPAKKYGSDPPLFLGWLRHCEQ